MYNDTQEKAYRYKIFKHNLEEINIKNQVEDHAVFSINKFSDMSKSEIISKYTGLSLPSLMQENFCRAIILDGPPNKAPINFDWRQYNAVTPVRVQGNCGSCWAFSTLAGIESQYSIKYNKQISLSVQQLVDCDTSNMGCAGGLLHTALEQIINAGGGVLQEEDYPYKGVDKQCNLPHNNFAVQVLGCYRYIVMNEEKLKDVLRAVGPIPVAIDAASIVDYSRGIIRTCTYYGLNHAVLLVGYGVQDGVPYWTLKNTWGDDWGEHGYFRVRQNVNSCGIINDLASTAVIK